MSSVACVLVALALVACSLPVTTASGAGAWSKGVWPVPQHFITTAGSHPLAADFTITGGTPISPVLQAAADRYQAIIRKAVASASASGAGAGEGAGAAIPNLELDPVSTSSALGPDTCYNYTIVVGVDGTAMATCESIYGCMYAMESFAQLAVTGTVQFGQIDLVDWPQHNHRGFMIDTGRRWFPVPLVKSVLDGMSFSKMNVLHWHLSDFCRFSIESTTYPELTANLTTGFYTQAEVRELIQYANARGIWVLPETDLPGHTKGWTPLVNEGLQFCTGPPMSEMYNDPAGKTNGIISKVVNEMAELFSSSQIYHLGCDETHVVPKCSLDNIKSTEVAAQKVVSGLGKIPMGWEEILFSTAAAAPGTIVNAWSRHTASEVIAAGFEAVESHANWFYLNLNTDYTTFWNDISPDFTPAQMKMLRGGEVSMWTDPYCDVFECGAFGSGHPDGYWMFPLAQNAPFTASISAVMWPRASVGGHAFWNYNATVSPSSSEFVSAYTAFATDVLIARGIDACPINKAGCTCDEVSRCGVPYKPA